MREFWTELWTKHKKELLFAVGMACFLAAGLVVWALPKNTEPANQEPVNQEPVLAQTEEAVLEAEAPKGDAVKWFLYITGSVRKPGVYQLPPGARLFHLVEAAGGLNNFADPVAFNLAAPLEDGMHVHIPKKGERKGERAILLDIPLYPGTVPSGPRSEFRESSGSLREKRNAEERNASAPIDVNRATEEELIALKGIGPVLAKNIVEYRRKNGRFKSVEDLLHVKGIGPKKLEGFRGSVVARP